MYILMQPDVRELSRFYQSRLGKMVQMCIDRRLANLWPDVKDRDILGLGYASPYLAAWQTTSRRLVSAMPARQGVEQWPGDGPVRSVLVDPELLPFAENCFDRILVVHGLEEAADPQEFMLQISHVLAAHGRVVLVVPHRIGLWSAYSGTPLGHGRSFSLFQVQQLMASAGLEVSARTQALFAPPHKWFASPASANAWERTGEIFWPFFGGALLVEATKMRTIDPRTRLKHRVFCPEPSP